MANTIDASVRGLGKSLVNVAAWYGFGATLGGSATGLAIGLMGRSIGSGLPTWALFLPVSAISGLVLWWPSSEMWPERARQIPRWWVQPPTWSGLALGGLVLGAGLTTHIRYSVFYLALTLSFVLGALSLVAACAVGATYGVVNGFTPLLIRSSENVFQTKRYQLLSNVAFPISRIVAGGILVMSLSAAIWTQ